jgi:hypothetical protein
VARAFAGRLAGRQAGWTVSWHRMMMVAGAARPWQVLSSTRAAGVLHCTAAGVCLHAQPVHTYRLQALCVCVIWHLHMSSLTVVPHAVMYMSSSVIAEHACGLA